ncbi:MAG: virulence RhuM family protein [Clostridiaceae bacterium]|nr:virulence RhuM family protein [Clostridiaceae bacterium]
MNEDKIILYQDNDNNVFVDVFFKDDTFWLTQKAMAELFDVDISTVNEHLKNIYVTSELEEASTIGKFPIVQKEGTRKVQREIKFYNLDAIIAVGYRVNSKKATQFRVWATKTLKEYIIKGFVLNDDMLKNGRPFGKDYFDELLERIREIRASERRFYQKITDLYAQCSYDYDSNAEITKEFFQTVQNKLLFAVTGNTAPELLTSRLDSTKPHMGLTTWKNAPDGKINKSDVTISKNVLDEKELKDLNRIVTMYLDYAEHQASRHIKMSMADWKNRLDAFLRFNDYEILGNAGRVSRAVADELANKEYEKFRVIQDKEFISDFDKTVSKLLSKGKNSDIN